jgi:DNA/RNA endonuclease G (NUC1)
MKHFLALFLLLAACFSGASAQTIKHHAFITHYNAGKGEPDSVSWMLTPAMVSCGSITRKDKFARDPEIANSTSPNDYKKSGYDKGHLFPFADAQCDSVDRVECFFMSNMLPQLHALNAGDWGTLEDQERKWAATDTIRIIAGGFGSKGKLKSGVNIPESCWKAIYVHHKWRAWVMPNETDSKGHGFDKWEVLDIKHFDQLVGLDL